MTKVYVVTGRSFEMECFEQSKMIFSIYGVFEHKADAAEFVETSYMDIDNNKTFYIAETELNVVDEKEIMMMQNTIFALRYKK